MGEPIISKDSVDRFEVAKYNDPAFAKETGLLEALAEAEGAFEATAIAYKLLATAELIKNKNLPPEAETKVFAFGLLTPFEDKKIRLDLFIEEKDGEFIIVRCLSKYERLSADELYFFPSFLDNNKSAKIIVIYREELHPLDKVFFDKLSGQYKRVKLIHFAASDE